MNYIVLDMEWNQPYCLKMRVEKPVVLHGEIVQIGAVKLDENLQVLDTFKIMVSPKYYTKMNKKVMKLTGITNDQLKYGLAFHKAISLFKKWCGDDFVFITWGPDDIRMLKCNIDIHKLDSEWLPCTYDVQLIYDSQTDKLNRQISLLEAMESMGIPALEAHDALNDAQNTVCICQRLDMIKGINEYESLFNYITCDNNPFGESRRSKQVYLKRIDALKDPEMIELLCPVCGEKVVCGDFVRQNFAKFICIAKCSKGHGLFVRFKFAKNADKKYRVSRVVYELNEEFENYFAERKELAEQARKACLQKTES